MADAAVSLVIDKLIQLLTQEAKLLKGVHEEVAVLKDDLEAIRAFLKDADLKAEKEGISEGVKVWGKQAREVAYCIEDVVDRYMLQETQHRHRHGSVSFLQRISSLVMKLKARKEIASEIQSIRKSLQKVKSRREEFQFNSSGQGASISNARNMVLHDPRVCSISIDESELVGIESPRNELISLLLSETSQRKVISVVGLGGVGKTTIAWKVYNNQSVKKHFGCHAWITVSQSYNRKELLRNILEKLYEERNEIFPGNIAAMDDSSLISKLREYLQAKRFLVVFDDIWDTGFWEDVDHALLDNDNRSRILMTTRNNAVADFCKRSSLVHVYWMEPLPNREAWVLFCKKAFKFEFEEQCPKDLEELSHHTVRRCGGLPLAIVVVGGLLATKQKKALEWKKLLDSLSFAMMEDPHLQNVTKILSLSYNDLPYNLKSCFLYLGMFPEDFCIRRNRLIRLWVAESFVQLKQGMTLEEVAEEYLNELIHRSLIQVDAIYTKGTASAIRVHDLVREVILSKSEVLSFSHISSNCSTFKGIARRLSINNRGSLHPKDSTKSQTRSIMVFDGIKMQKPVIDAIFAKCKLLTTLDFENCQVDHIPKELGELLHLRYLNLRNTLVSELPKSIGKLHNLESIDLRDSQVKELPVEINRFSKLRHLLGSFGVGLQLHGSIGHLEFLQTLCGVRADNVRLLNELGMLKQLRKLGICDLKREDGRDLCISLEKMTNLQSLWVISSKYWREGIIEVSSMSSPPIHLQTLKLSGKLERLPDWISKLYNLSKLQLYNSRMMDDPIRILQRLPNLEFLRLFHGYNGEKLHFEGGGFQKLKTLDLEVLVELDTIIIDEGAMPVLEELRIAGCRQLKEVPSGIQSLKDLKTIYFVTPPVRDIILPYYLAISRS